MLEKNHTSGSSQTFEHPTFLEKVKHFSDNKSTRGCCLHYCESEIRYLGFFLLYVSVAVILYDAMLASQDIDILILEHKFCSKDFIHT